jgi:hypothetical protein
MTVICSTWFFNAAQLFINYIKFHILGLEKSYYLAVDYEHNLKNDSITFKKWFWGNFKDDVGFVVKL